MGKQRTTGAASLMQAVASEEPVIAGRSIVLKVQGLRKATRSRDAEGAERD